ncbi:MAG: hypothetical protein HFJ36_05200 [Clostridia bacterium]|nr:hypothetical protein [Clostridia bacterium]
MVEFKKSFFSSEREAILLEISIFLAALVLEIKEEKIVFGVIPKIFI